MARGGRAVLDRDTDPIVAALPEQAVHFDEQDFSLFHVDDPRLRTDALKHSILPRLGAVVQEV